MNVPAYLAAVGLAAALQTFAFLWLRPSQRVTHWFAAGNFLGAWTLYAILADVHLAHWLAVALILLTGSLTIEVVSVWDNRTSLGQRVADLEAEKDDLLRRIRERDEYEAQRRAGHDS